jgi:uncharacterized protein
MYIERMLAQKIKPFLARKEAISITGPRQAGKTTLTKHLQQELKKTHQKIWALTFERKADLDLFEKNIEDFKTLCEAYDCVIIDEFQYAKNGGRQLKYLYDTTKVKFIITGSSSLELTFQTGKYMVGRIFNFELAPFSFKEFASMDRELDPLLKKINPEMLFDFQIKAGFGAEINQRLAKKLEDFMLFGGYPAVCLSKTVVEKKKVLEGLVENYLLKDIKSLLNLATDDELMRLAKFLAAQIGNLVKYDELSDTSSLPYAQVLKHLNVLEKTYILNLIKPFFTNKRLELSKNPKCFFVDLGLRNQLLDDFRPMEARNDAGAIAENYAFSMLRKNFPELPLKYWRTKSKAEVDFVIEKDGAVIPIEVKYCSKRIVGKSLYSFIEKFSPSKALILTKDYLAEEKIGTCTVQWIPLGYF